jgi:hypothetical protein
LSEPPPKVKPEAVEDDEENEEDEEYTPVRETRSKGKGTKRATCIHSAIFALTHLPEATGTSKTEFGQVKIMKEFA